MGRKKGQKPQAEISKIKHVQDEKITVKLKEVIATVMVYCVFCLFSASAKNGEYI